MRGMYVTCEGLPSAKRVLIEIVDVEMQHPTAARWGV
jgi:hypothetical protein